MLLDHEMIISLLPHEHICGPMAATSTQSRTAHAPNPHSERSPQPTPSPSNTRTVLQPHPEHPAVIIPPEVGIWEISHFLETGNFQENFKKTTLHVTVDSQRTLHHPGGHADCSRHLGIHILHDSREACLRSSPHSD